MEISEKCYSEFTVSPTRRQSRRRGGSNRDVRNIDLLYRKPGFRSVSFLAGMMVQLRTHGRSKDIESDSRTKLVIFLCSISRFVM